MSQHILHRGQFMTPAAKNDPGALTTTSALPAPIAIDAAEDVYRYYLQQPEPWAVLPRLTKSEQTRSHAPHRIPYHHHGDVNDSSMMSKSIPIRSTITKTPSELQLCEDERVADYRDYVVFSRIVDHITRHQFASRNLRLRYENDDCLLNIIRTRQGDSDIDENAPELNDATMNISKKPDMMMTDPGYFYVTDQDTSNCYSTTSTPCLFAQRSFAHVQQAFLSLPADDDDEEMFILEM